MDVKRAFWVFAISLTVRLLFFFAADRDVSEMYANPDCREYLQYGRNLANHAIFSLEEAPPLSLSAYRAPLYPLLVAAAIKISPEESVAVESVVLLQIVLSAVTASLTSFLAYHLLKNVQWAMWAGLATGFDPQAILITFSLWTETVFSFLLVFAMLFLFEHFEIGKPLTGSLIVSALALGCSILCNPKTELLTFLAVPLVLLLDKRFSIRARVAQSIMPFCGICLLLSFPWLLRNYTKLGLCDLTVLGPYNKLRAAAGLMVTRQSKDAFHSVEWKPEFSRLGRSYAEELSRAQGVAVTLAPDPNWLVVYPDYLTGEYCRFISGKASRVIVQNFDLYLRHSTDTLLRVLFAFNKDAPFNILNIPPSKERLSDLPRSLIAGDWRLFLKQSRKFQFLDYLGFVWSGTMVFLLDVLAILGLGYLAKRRELKAFLVILSLIGSLIVVTAFVVLFSGTIARFRVPAVPYLSLLAILTIQEITRQIRSQRGIALP